MIRAMLLALLLLASWPAAAQMACGTHDGVERSLRGFGEVKIADAIDQNGKKIEVYMARNGNFSIILVYSSRLACMPSHGTDWRFMKPPKEQTVENPS